MATQEMDERLRWLETRITSSLRPRNEDLKNLFTNDETRSVLVEFITNEDLRCLYVHAKSPKNGLQASLSPPAQLPAKAVFFLKTGSSVKLTKDNMDENVIYIDGANMPLEHMDMLAREVYLPLLCTDTEHAETVAGPDKLMDVLHRLMSSVEVTHGHQQGSIVLPLPSIEVLAEAAAATNRRAAVIHVLESTVIGWIKQIRGVLKHDPVAELSRLSSKPRPDDEIQVWSNHLSRLHSINTQLDAPIACDILLNLEEADSSYSHSFQNVRKEIGKAVHDTNEHLLYLETMRSWLDKLQSGRSPKEIQQIFAPLVHTMYLVWMHSKYYHERRQFQILLRVVSNEIVAKSESMVGEDLLQDTLQSYSRLKDALRVCAAYRGTYLDWREKANAMNKEKVEESATSLIHRPQGQLWATKLYGMHAYDPRKPTQKNESTTSLGVEEEWKDSPWPPRNARCFDLMNRFMERCNDVLELVETTRHFRMLESAAEIGGAGGRSLDALVQEIHQNFAKAMDDFITSAGNILDVDDSHNFNKSFFKFRSVVKDLEAQLASVLNLSFLQCPTVASQLRLLEVFEGVSSRELVQKHLKDKDQALVSSFIQELLEVKTIFNSKVRDPPMHVNLPRTVSKLLWIKGLQARITEPMEKFRRISPHSLGGDAGWQMRDSYTDAMKEFQRCEKQIVEHWQTSVQSELRDRLKQPLLVAENYDEDEDLRPQVVHVNLDPELILLLREIHYFSQPPYNIKLPQPARALIRNTDAATLRVTAARLETIVSKYNEVMRTISDVERPLFERKLAKIDVVFDEGLHNFTWKTTESADFIEIASSLVCNDLHGNLTVVQTNCDDITLLAGSWSQGQLDVFAAREEETSYTMDDLVDMQKQLDEDLTAIIVPSGHRIHALLQESFEAVQISRASPAWEAYVEFVDSIVLDGLKKSTVTSLETMHNQLVMANISQDPYVPILTIRLELIENVVSFNPPLDQNSAMLSVQELVTRWLESFLSRGALVQMLGRDSTNGYEDYIAVDDDVKQLVQQILQLVRDNAEECKKLLDLFKDYHFLWMQHVQQTFDDFLHGKLSPNPLRSAASSPQGLLRQIASAKSDARSSASGRSRADSIGSMQSAGVLGTAERSFLTPKNATSNMNVPSLDDFDNEIDIYRVARDNIHTLQDHQDVGWLRVDVKPIKQVLITHASRWMWTFTKYLTDQVTEMLTTLDKFLKRIEPDIEGITGEERDTASFMRMMRLFNEVSAQQHEMDGKFQAMHRTVLLLEKYQMQLPAATEKLFKAAPGRWNNLKTKVSLAKQRLGPRIQEESKRITKDLARFGMRVEELVSDISQSEVYMRECTFENAWEILGDFRRRLDHLENEAQDLIELQELLETAVVNFSLLPQCRQDLRNLKLVWETWRVVSEQQNEWRLHRWQKIDTKFLRTATQEQLARVKGLPEDTFMWDVYMGMQESILIIQACLPLIDDLRNPAMRTRHWKQLVRITGGVLQIDNDSLKKMTLGQLLELGLQKHVDDVRNIVQRAVKEVTIESSLKTYEEIWLSKLFELLQHIKSKPTTTAPALLDEGASQYSGSEATHTMTGDDTTRPSRRARATSRTSNNTSVSRTRRGSTASLPASLANLGEDSGQLFLLSNTETIFEELESHQVSLQSMGASSAAGSFSDEVLKWQKRLQTIEAVLTVWLEVQDKWVELEEVFSGADVRTTLSHDANMFAAANRDFRRLMRATEKNPNVLQCCSRKGILNFLEKMNGTLEHCRKSLLHHLERKRQKFPRFYFLSMEDVLHVVCNGHNLKAVSPYLCKLFPDMGSVKHEECEPLSNNTFQITAVLSSVGEKLPLQQPMECEGPIENWLPTFLTAIKTALQSQLHTALGYEQPQTSGPREIHSAGARKVPVPDKKEGRRSKTRSRNNSRAGSQMSLTKDTHEEAERTPSWTLDHVTEIVQLATHIQMTAQVEGCLKAAEGGERNAIQDNLSKLSNMLQATAVMLKGIDDDKEAGSKRSKIRKTDSQASLPRDKEQMDIYSQGYSMSHRGRSMLGSTAGSMYQMDKLEQGTIGTIEERNSLGDADLEQRDTDALTEPMEPPIDTMKTLAPPVSKLSKGSRKEEEEEEKQTEPSEMKLMLFPAQIQKISNIIALLAHYKDVLQRFLDEQNDMAGVGSSLVHSFHWRSQVKYNYQEDTKFVSAKVLDKEFDYGFEYQGSASRLVITPLTERVFVSLTQAIAANMGALCQGPSGHGKQETIRELSMCLGCPLYKFCCTHSMDTYMLGDIFKGLATTGCWVSFTHLNILQPSLLSVMAQLLRAVQEAQQAGKPAVSLQGEEVTLQLGGACFATISSTVVMGHTQSCDGHLSFKSAVACLPSAILQLFRVVSVVNVELGLAMEVMLWSQGFLQAASLAKKLVTLYDLCRKMLTTVTFISENTILGEEGVSGTHGWSLQNLKHVITDAGVTLDAMVCLYASEKEMAAMAAESHDLKEMPLVMDIASKWRDKVRSVPGYAGSTVASSKDGLSPNTSPEPGGDQTAQGQDGERDANNEGDSLLPDAETLASMELEALVTAIRNTFMPRLNGRDASIFMTLVSDIFPGVDVPMTFEGEATDHRASGDAKLNTPLVKVRREEKERYVPTPTHEKPGPLDDIGAAITVATHELGLMPGTAFQARVAQLAQMANTHPAVIVTGPAGCGKSSCLQTFITAQRQMGKTVTAQTVFTRAMESEELFGFNDPVTREWHNGIIPSLLRRYCLLQSSGDFLRTKPTMKILQLDGDVDAGQMEIFDSLLHHEGYLVTGNNERMKIADSLRVFWEMETLTHVSPSMVGRVAVLSMDMTDVGWQLVMARWLDGRPEREQEILRSLAEKYISPTLEYLAACTSPAAMLGSRETAARPRMRRVVPVTDANMVSTFCALLEALLSQQTDVSEMEMERFFNFAAIWAFGGTLEADYHTAFSQWWRHQFVAGPDGVDYPESGEVWDYYVDTDSREWTDWMDAVPAYSLPHGQGIPPDAYVHTVTVEQLSYLLGLLFDSNKPVMFVGEAGCGKTAIMKERVRTFCMGEMAEARSITVRSNRFTTAHWLWKTVEETLEWKHGRTYIPKGNKRLMVVVDDMNLARVDRHQSQSANEMIRQHIDCGGVFDPETQQWRQVKNVTYVSTVNPNTTAPVPSLSSRLLRHFAIFNCPYPRTNELHHIFTTLLTTHFTSAISANMMAGSSIQGLASSQHDKGKEETHSEEHMKDLLSTLVTVTLETQDKMRSIFLSTSERVHYIFTIRDLIRIFKNLCLSLKPGINPDDLLYLWTHECNWVYGHRMVNEVDVSRYKQAFVTAVRKHFTNEEQLNLVVNPKQPIFTSIEENESGLVTAGPQRPAAGGQELSTEEHPTDGFVPSFDEEAMRDVMKEGLREYNKSNPIMKMSFHNTIMENIARLCRVITSPHEVSHALLCGEGCPGMAPLIARLSAHLCGFQPLKINPVTDSGDEDKLALFKSELVAAYTRAGGKGEKLLCILTEDELLEEEFLVPITDFVVTGVTSRLFTPEEQTAIVNSIRTEVTQAGLTYTREIAWDFFLRTATKNFRICLIFPSMGPDFQRRCRSLPALFSRSNILFLGHWERNQLVEHAYYHLKDAENFPVVQRENLAHLLSSMHISLRQQDGQEISWGEFHHITNATYEKFVERFVSMSAQRFEEILFLHEKMKQILERIDAENKKAMQLKTQLEHERVVLQERKQGTIQLLAQIGQDTAITEQQVRIVRRQLQKIYHLKKSLPDYQVAHERAVYKAIAIVADTKKVVEAMNMDNLVALRSLHQPDPVLEDLMAAIIMLLKSPNSDLTWNKGAKRQMANLERFREELLGFDENQLPEVTIEVVEQYLKKPGFTAETMQAKADNNVAVGALCNWVRGVVRYNRLMISKVKPLHNKVEQTAAAVEMAEHRMSTLETKRKALETRLQDLAKGFEEATIDKKEQEAKTELMDRNLETAARFRKILAKEHEHFVQIFNSLARREVGIAGGVAMAAAFAIYLGPYDHGFRRLMLTLHWPHCLQERGVPLVIDSLDPMKGHVIDWAIDTGSPMLRDYSENGFTMGESSKAESELYTTARQDMSPVKSAEREQRAEADGAEERVHFDETAGPDNDKSGTEEDGDVPGTEAGTEQHQGEEPQDTDMQYESEPGEGNGGENESEVSSHASGEEFVGYTVENMPMISKVEYNKYVGALAKLLVGEKQLQEWNTQGFSPHQIENVAILVSSWNRPPFLIDPHRDAVKWLKRVMRKQGKELVCVDMQRRLDPAVLVLIEKALVTGLSLLLQNCTEHVESMLTPLIYLQNHMDVEEPEEQYIVQYCGRRLQSPPSFRLYLSSLVTRPQLDAEIASTTSLISYTTSSETLQEDLLSRAFARVRHDLYQEQKQALLAIREYRVALKSLAKRLAQRLLEGESDDIWDSTEFVTKVVQQKQQVYHKLQHAERVLEDILALRDELAPVAERGALLFSLLRSLEMVQWEYKFSKTFFLSLFDKAVGEDVEEEEEEEEMGSASKDITPRQDKESRHGKSARSARGDDGVSVAGSTKQQEDGEGETETSAETGRPKSEELLLPDAPDVPTTGVSFESMSVNQTRMLVDGLTQMVYDSVSQSLYPEHRLLFATMLCLHMQLEGEEFAEEELSLLLQGNPGLGGGLPLSLEDFDCEAPTPEWIPQDKFEDLMAMSVLPGPLDSLCKHVAENADDWEKWYLSPAPEEDTLPYRPSTSQEEHGDAGTGSPDLGPMTDFHQLLIMRCLRPDRLPFAMARYVQKHMPGVLGNKTTPSLDAILDTAGDSMIGVLVLLAPSLNSSSQPNVAAIDIKKHPVDVLKSLAKGIPVEHVAVGEGCESRVDVAIDTAHNNDGWVIIEDIHLASPQFLHELKLHLARVSATAADSKEKSAREGSRSSFRVFLTSEPSTSIPVDLLNTLHKVAWDVIGPHLLGVQETQGPAQLAHGSLQGMLKKAIGAALSSVPAQSWDKLRDKSNNIRNMVFGLCVVQGVLMARQLYGTRGLSQQYPLSGVQLQQGIDVLVGRALNDGGEEPTVDEACNALAEMVYGNIMESVGDRQYATTLLHEILYLITNQSGRLMLGNVPIPTPAANVDPSEYPQWFESVFDSDHSASDALLLDESVDRDWNEASSCVYVAHLDQLLTHTQCGPYPSKSIVSKEVSLDVQRLRFAIDLCVDSLPPLLELGRLPSQVDSSTFSFQYHRPSMLSVATVPPDEMPESLGFILLQECHWLNLLLCHVRQSLHNLDQCMLGGTNAIPASLTQLAEALQSEEVPVSWTHPRCRPSSHTILSWLADLQERYKQFHEWVKRGIVSKEPDMPTSQPLLSHGQLTSVWLGGLVNPAALFTALRQEKAVLLEVPVSEVTMSCEVVVNEGAVVEEEGGLYVQGLYIQGAAWDWQAGCLTEAEMGLTSLPPVYVKPVLTSEVAAKAGEEVTLYNCPVFMNKARQVCSLTLPLKCPSLTENFVLSGAAVILDAGCLFDEHKKGRTFAGLKKEPIPMSARDTAPSIPAYSAPTTAKRRVSHDPQMFSLTRNVGIDQGTESGIHTGRESQQSRQSRHSYTSATSQLSESAKQPVPVEEGETGSGHHSPTVATEPESTQQHQLAQDSGVVNDDHAGEVPPSTADYSSYDEKPAEAQQGFDPGYSADDSQSESRKESDATEAGYGRARGAQGGLTSDDDTLGYNTDRLDSREGVPNSQPSY